MKGASPFGGAERQTAASAMMEFGHFINPAKNGVDEYYHRDQWG